jgi:thiosulfate dehydrogenase
MLCVGLITVGMTTGGRAQAPDLLPDDAYGRTVRLGRDLIVKTSSLIGPDAPDAAMRYGGNGLDCESCHLNAGCMERSLNGKALPVDSAAMKAMETYIAFISASEPVGKALAGRGTPELALPETAADPAQGQLVFNATCAVCHGSDGQGQRLSPAEASEAGRRYRVPPLWGPDSFNDGAGMARAITAARFVHANMPFGTTFEAPKLPDADAFDVVAFIGGQPRPHRDGLEGDYPDRSRKPVDAAYPPFVGPFTADQHRLGPWPPIQAWIKTSGTKTAGAN